MAAPAEVAGVADRHYLSFAWEYWLSQLVPRDAVELQPERVEAEVGGVVVHGQPV